jgi:hypothetical protein
MMKLPEDGDLTQEDKDILVSFVCSAYCPKGIHIQSIPDLRWHLFCKHLAESNKLPPTIGALEEHIECVQVQSRVWCQATVMWQELFNPFEHGYYQNNNSQILPITTKVLTPDHKKIFEGSSEKIMLPCSVWNHSYFLLSLP